MTNSQNSSNSNTSSDFSSVNPEELVKFSLSQDDWWDQNGEFRILHEINPLRIKYILEQISNSDSDILNDLNQSECCKHKFTILDVGAGGGLLTIPLAMHGFDLTALDLNQSNLDTIMSHAKTETKQNVNIDSIQNIECITTKYVTQHTNNNLNITPICMPLEEHLKKHVGIKYDLVICSEVIEHVNNFEIFFQNLVHSVRPGGLLIISTINRNLKAYFMAILCAEYLFKFVKPGTHDYHKFIKPSEIARECQKYNCHIADMTGLKFELNKNKWTLCHDLSVNYFVTILC